VARAFKKAAQDALDLADGGQNAAPILSHIVNAAIAYTDYITATRAGVVNSQDHAAATRLLREVLRQELPDAQEQCLRRILGMKDAAQYGARVISLEVARQRMQDIEKFAAWAEDVL
jgi:ABC-type enterochelin transport system ATPase subunit